MNMSIHQSTGGTDPVFKAFAVHHLPRPHEPGPVWSRIDAAKVAFSAALIDVRDPATPCAAEPVTLAKISFL